MIRLSNDLLVKLRETQPYHIYQRIRIVTIENLFLFQLPFGFWYIMRELRMQYAEIDARGTAFSAPIAWRVYLMGANKWPQNAPVPIQLSLIPGSNGVTLDGVGNMTVGSIGTGKQINSIHPVRDTINIAISWSGVGTPPDYVDVDCMGYLIPAGAMWKGTDYA